MTIRLPEPMKILMFSLDSYHPNITGYRRMLGTALMVFALQVG